MKKKSLTLFLLLCLSLGLTAQTFGPPPPLLPNPARSNNAAPSQPVYAPETTSAKPPEIQAPGAKKHLVKKGESLYRIAKLYNVTVDDIKLWNHLKSDAIAVGATLSIGNMAPHPNNAVPAQYNQMTERAVAGWLTGRVNHTVLAGESLSTIANYYGLTEARLRWMNNLGPQDPIPAGFVLNIDPCLTAKGSPPPVSYEQLSAPGNVSSSTGQDFNSPVPRYTPPARPADQYNAPNSYNYTGSTPGGAYTYRREDQYDPNPANSSAVPNSYEYSARSAVPNPSNTNVNYGGMIYENGKRVHVVGTSDTLETIADHYQLSAERLRALNKMGAFDVVWPNQKLLLE